MSERTAPPCPHDVGPGIPVCLRCRKENRIATRERRRRVLFAIAATALGVATLGAAGAAGLLDSELRAAGFAIPVASVTPEPSASQSVAASTTDSVAAPVESVSPDTTVVSVASVTIPPAAELAAAIGEGRTSLRGGVVAERRGDEITVHFDTPVARTRRPEKFEDVLRATLPQIYGARVDSALRAIAPGTLVPAHGLTTDLPTQGLYVPVPGGPTLRIWPETRPGETGPLVVRYRVLVAP